VSEKLVVLQENPVFSIFQKITEIPHQSEHEQKLAAWIIDFAKEHQWPYEQDSIGNLIVRVPATQGLEKAKPVCFQAHLDMVCVDAQGSVYGEGKFPLKLKIEDDWLSADGTTLGGDNGIGIALALAAASHLTHGPLELLFTVQEENGIIGASRIELAIKSKKMINLDSEDWKTVFIGCAGGCRCDIETDLSFQKLIPDDLTSWKITVAGLQGGHSGVEIHKNRGNAIIIMARIINELSVKFKLNLGSLNGGSKDNVIPSSSESILVTDAEETIFSADFGDIATSLINEFSSAEPGLRIKLARANSPSKIISISDTEQIIQLILALPNGVQSMSSLLPGLVQTSCNIGIVNTDMYSGKISIALMPRSSSAADLKLIKEKMADVCNQFLKDSSGFKPKLIFRNEYPGWQPNQDSELLKTTKSVWSDNFSDNLEITSIHAGLECGILINKFPGLDAISLGPDIKGAHSAMEKVSISSVNLCYSFLSKLLNELAKE